MTTLLHQPAFTGPLARATRPNRHGMLIVVSGPSGVGKGTVVQQLRQDMPELVTSVSVTTRPPRPGEQDGVHYFFRTEEQFMQMVEGDDLLEWSQFVTGTYYGTPRAFVEEAIVRGQDVVLEIDVKGAIQVKESWPHGCYIFLLPPTMEELEQRLKKRQTDAAEAIRQRLSVAVDELNFLPLYDYQVVNDDIAAAVGKLHSILKAEKCRVKRRLPQR
jgi:guanylate kinase